MQEDVNFRLGRAFENYKKSSKDRRGCVDYLKARLDLLEELWAQFTQTHTLLVQDSDSAELQKSSYVVNNIYEVTEELYVEYKYQIKTQISKVNPPITASIQNVENVAPSKTSNKAEELIKLPKISIPTFSGDYSAWASFRDLFVSLIHKNKSLDDVQKLHYLKSHLSGEAEQLLRHVPITLENYSTSWEQLESRYNNKKYLSNCILRRFLSQRNLTTESATGLKELLDTTNECLQALKCLGIDIKSWDIIIVHLICLKLDCESRKQWELKSSESGNELPTYEQFKSFLETRFRALEFIDPKASRGYQNTHKVSNAPAHSKIHHMTALSCAYCSEGHKISHCKEFSKIDTDSRRGFVQSHNLCFNCLGPNHSVYSCRQSFRCRICKGKHHSLLHPKNVSQTTESQRKNHPVVANVVVPTTTSHSSAYEVQDESTMNIKTYFSTSCSQVLLATALVNVTSKSGKIITLRCLLDQGSQASLITESAVQLLGLRKIGHKSTISGLGSDESAIIASKSRVTFKIQSLLDASLVFEVNAFVLNKLTSVLPERKIVVQLWSEFKNLKLADPSFDQPNKIDLLLGADIYGKILLEGVVKGSQGAPIAQKTALGWILSGPILREKTMPQNTVRVNHVNVNDNELLKQFWEMESDNSIMPPKKDYSEEERRCQEIYAATTKRDSSGRYVVKLPFREENPRCKEGKLEIIAARRFSQLERRFDKDPQLKARYTDVIKEYHDLGHMEIVPKEDQNKPGAVYLPHHAVIREDKSTSKTRVVFDASCPGINGISLNQDLLVGPQLQQDLRQILLRWRCFPISLVSDIVKMYRQVKVYDEDADFQRILWRNHQHEPLTHFRLLRVTFGTAAAPYLAVRTLHQVAYDHGEAYPLAADRVLKDFYMDDLLTGCETVDEGEKIYNELNEMLGKAGFELQKWCTNNEQLMNRFNNGENISEATVQLKLDTVMKVLGLTWNREADTFEYAVQLPPLQVPITKRRMISDISRLFDPLGWLAPVIIRAKIFIQKLWLTGIDWDDEVPPQLMSEWLNFRDNLSQITKFNIPRWVHVKKSNQIIELQGFSDASSEAYAAVVYLRTISENGTVNVSLVTAKTKVAPIKQVSIPRLELCGAVLLTKLLMEVARVLNVEPLNIHAWTDSTIVLAWLNSRPNRWKTFVANRVSEILTSLEPHQWAHVQSKDNPADCASRGTNCIHEEYLWKEGPSWLKEKDITYKITQHETEVEIKKSKLCLVNTCDSDDSTAIIERFSSLRRLTRVIAYCKRFKKSTQREAIKPWLTAKEIQDSLLTCIILVQKRYFEVDIINLKKGNRTIKKGKLTCLNPFVDEAGILRVGGRLQHAQMTEQMKHPIIIPEKSHFTDLLIADAHEKTLHGGPNLMLNYLRSKYFILGAKNLAKFYVRKCVTCIRYTASSNHPLMGQLPAARGMINRPFRHSGLDYAGPVNIRTSKGRGHHSYKGYICLFICMSTRAVHLEAVSDMTSQGFLAAFKRFVARRGHCSDLWSDNGTNFVGAARELKQLFSEEKSSIATEIAEQLATNNTTWHFIPPHAPNFGGLWEAGIKSTKHHLKRIVGNSTLTFEEMSTVLSQIEACLNSRPISKGSDSGDAPEALTPGHFLVSEPLVLVPDSNYTSSTVSSLRRWQLTQKLVQDFWRRWSSEYLTQFYHRYKWAHQIPEPRVGDVVLVKEDALPPSRWLYGKIVEKHTGADNITRVVSLKCKDSIIKRAVNKLCFLPIT